jgi:hypothetical protein
LSDQDSPGAGAGVKVALGKGAVTGGDAGVVTGFDKGKGVVAMIEVNKINSIIFLHESISSINLM